MDFDYIVIGSGFGGSVMTCRLSEKGHKVALLERGRKYGMHEFPRRIHEVKEKLFWDPKDKKYGFMEFRNYEESDLMSVTASGLGGGSLIYANVLMRMEQESFAGWPQGYSRAALDPYYDKAIDMLEASIYPYETNEYYRDTPKTERYIETAKQLKRPTDATADPEFVYPHLAIRFKGDFPGQQSLNAQGALQSSCTKCGECDIGCNIHAKNTLDLNYIKRAQNEKTGGSQAEVFTQAEVETIEPIEGGYKVTYCDPQRPSEKKELTAKKVVVSAGSLGSTALLLKMKKHGYLPNLSEHLGKGWCGNGDLEGTVLNTPTDNIPTKGPVITGAIKYNFKPYPDGFPHSCYIQDAGYPVGLAWYLCGKAPSPSSIVHIIQLGWKFLTGYLKRLVNFKDKKFEINLGDDVAHALDRDRFVRKSYMLLGMGRDRSDGTITLRNDDEPLINWNMDGSQLHYDRVRDEMKQIAEKMQGTFADNPLTHLDKIIAVHPIGGCCMSDSQETGVVDAKGEVHGYPGLYVVDASILPTSVGPNPSLTITAVAEYIADQI